MPIFTSEHFESEQRYKKEITNWHTRYKGPIKLPRGRPRKKKIAIVKEEYEPVRTEEVIELFEKYGIKMSPKKLQRWARTGLIPKPKRIHLGAKEGSRNDWPEETFNEGYASYLLKEGTIKLRHDEDVKNIRDAVLSGDRPDEPLLGYLYDTWKLWSKGPPEKTEYEFDPDDPLFKRIKAKRAREKK